MNWTIKNGLADYTAVAGKWPWENAHDMLSFKKLSVSTVIPSKHISIPK